MKVIKKLIKKLIRIIIGIGKVLLTLCLLILSYAVPLGIRDLFIAPSVGLFSAAGRMHSKYFIFFCMLPLMKPISTHIFKRSMEEVEENSKLKWLYKPKFKGKKPLIITCWCIGMYVMLLDVTYVTDEQIIYHDWRNPKGVSYSYQDVRAIECGFETRRRLGRTSAKRGDFYYRIDVGDRVIDLSDETANCEVERYEDTYLELEEFDAALMEHGPKKVSSKEGAKYCDLGSRYVERYLRIVQRTKKGKEPEL